MTKQNDDHPWKKRQEIPDPQVRDAADQYEAAHRLLEAQPHGSGVLLPSINTAAVAIELYLKSLSARKVYSPSCGPAAGYTVHADPALRGRDGHRLQALLEEVPEDIRSDVEAAFARATTGVLREALGRCEQSFVVSRFPFEGGSCVSQLDLSVLRQVVRFLHNFIADRQPVERIEWT